MDLSPVVEMQNISKRFGAIVALDNVNVDFQLGEVHSIVGENGAGKSTLVKILTGYHTGYDGSLQIRGKTVTFSAPRDALHAGIGCVYQERNLIPALSVAENIFLGRMPSLAPGVVNWKSIYSNAGKQLKSLGLDFDYTKRVDSYPQGIRQMTEIARIIFSGADVIVLDEPTSALSIQERERLFVFLKTLKAQGKCIIYISHFLEEVLGVSDRITILKDGKKVNTYQREELDKETIIRLMSRRFVKQIQRTKQHPGDLEGKPVMLDCRNVSVRGAVQNINFNVRAGEAIGFYGNVGSGTIQLAEALYGLRNIEQGELILEGKKVGQLSPENATNLGLRFIPEERRSAIWLGQKLSRNVALANLKTISKLIIREDHEVEATHKVLGLMDVIPNNPHMLVEWFSGGNQQKAIVGRCLLEVPRLLIICEPANGMDVGAKAGIIEKLWDIKSKGVGIIIVSTDPEVIVEICDRAFVFRRGEIRAELEAKSLTKEGLVRYG